MAAFLASVCSIIQISFNEYRRSMLLTVDQDVSSPASTHRAGKPVLATSYLNLAESSCPVAKFLHQYSSSSPAIVLRSR